MYCQPINCTYCGHRLEYPLGSVRAEITLNRSTFCETCRETHDKTRTLLFHNVECLRGYINLDRGTNLTIAANEMRKLK